MLLSWQPKIPAEWDRAARLKGFFGCYLGQPEKTETHLFQEHPWIINSNQKSNNRKKENCLTSFCLPKNSCHHSGSSFIAFFFSVHHLHTDCIHGTQPLVLLKASINPRSCIFVTSHKSFFSYCTLMDTFGNTGVWKEQFKKCPLAD